MAIYAGTNNREEMLELIARENDAAKHIALRARQTEPDNEDHSDKDGSQ